jgi:site-specific DNA recombinase
MKSHVVSRHSAPAVIAKKRCAIYCRVSTDERLDQEYNSLEAQRDAGLAYVASQRHDGWLALDDQYIDGGFSGGTLERPALKRLFADVEAGRIDVIVVYKLDRLTRSLADFARIVDVLDKHNVTFVSVTQQFNTTTSMGRLTLNILLSFAQFEREVTGERIRDKIAASIAKGMWMGGVPPLGYDVVNRKLIVNESEAALVREIFRRFAEHGSAARLVRELEHEGHTTKVWTTQTGKLRSANTIDQQYLFKLLRNRIYVGEMTLRNKSFPGQHTAIVSNELWAAVEQVIIGRKQGPREQKCAAPALLAGILYAPDGQRMLPTFTKKANGRRYRYYAPYLHKRRGAGATLTPGKGDMGTLPAAEIESAVLTQIHARLVQPEMLVAAWKSAAHSNAGKALDEPHAILALKQMGQVWQQLFPAEQQRIARLMIERVQIHERGLDIAWRDDGWSRFGPEIRHHAYVQEQHSDLEASA